eukprot:SAG11_NODE_31644_length_290_cov_0.811518_1_plen_62_part_00
MVGHGDSGGLIKWVGDTGGLSEHFEVIKLAMEVSVDRLICSYWQIRMDPLTVNAFYQNLMT